ncbi:tripeptidyl peptidase precursor [Ophiostoma piceae UAMH 11346]|uniref:tripeptidyl-peptidase II n=1 Tax=Ophiostoma piceae (strain UAMH 11346) TaxID=1262450 RepID=S3DBI6_OPHP1|nr:tripeptidyl peptidase precursor [Ophiostoma piceae UAMH 11346]
MRSSLVAALAGPLYILAAHGKPSSVLEHRQTLPDGWNLESKAPSNTSLGISIALAQPRLVDLEKALLQRAESQTPWAISLVELRTFQTPAEDAGAKVVSWLARNGAPGAVQDGAWVKLNATVETLRRIFDADMAYYTYNSNNTSENIGTDYTVLRTRSYSIPASLSSCVDFIFPLSHFMPPTSIHRHSTKHNDDRLTLKQSQHNQMKRGPNKASTPATACVPDTVTPNCIREVYNWPLPVTGDVPDPSSSSVRLGIAGFLDEYINYEDVADFLRTYAPGLSQQSSLHHHFNFTVELVNGGANIQTPRYRAGIEASLDVQYVMALAYPTQIIYYSTGGRGDKIDRNGHLVDSRHSDNEPYLKLLQYLVALPDSALPHILSISYSDDEQSVPWPYAMRVCQLFMQLTARGTTVLVATGDGGSRGIGRSVCKRNDGSGRRTLLPTFPASCPWVTAVGATDAPIVANVDGIMVSPPPPRIAANYSSGGFSNYFSRPSWQNSTVDIYVSSQAGAEKQGLFNSGGRAVPDISAMGSKFKVVLGGKPSSVDGTSASTPLVASMVAMANDARMRAGKPALGWLNPILYSDKTQSVLQDITKGTSRGCPFNETDAVPGWPATPGWDAVTGLGVPSDVSAFIKVLIDA